MLKEENNNVRVFVFIQYELFKNACKNAIGESLPGYNFDSLNNCIIIINLDNPFVYTRNSGINSVVQSITDIIPDCRELFRYNKSKKNDIGKYNSFYYSPYVLILSHSALECLAVIKYKYYIQTFKNI